MERANGHRGIGVLKRALELYATGSAGTKSRYEDAFLARVKREPCVNVELLGSEVDFHWPGWRLVVEVDAPAGPAQRSRARSCGRRPSRRRAGRRRVGMIVLDPLPARACSRPPSPAMRRCDPERVPLTDHEDCLLIVIDAQPGFYPPDLPEVDRAAAETALDARGVADRARRARCRCPIVVTEEEPERNGRTDRRFPLPPDDAGAGQADVRARRDARDPGRGAADRTQHGRARRLRDRRLRLPVRRRACWTPG